MYLVLSAFTSSPISLVAGTKASAFSFSVCMLPPSIIVHYIYCIRQTPTSAGRHFVSYYGLTNPWLDSQQRQGIFLLSKKSQTGSGTHSALHSKGSGGSFHRFKLAGVCS